MDSTGAQTQRILVQLLPWPQIGENVLSHCTNYPTVCDDKVDRYQPNGRTFTPPLHSLSDLFHPVLMLLSPASCILREDPPRENDVFSVYT